MTVNTIGALLLLLIFHQLSQASSFPLSTKGRWIIDEKTGQRVKLHCANWPTHNEPMLAEGLHAKPLSFIVAQIAEQGFNCVRLTWATYMFTRPSYGNVTVEETFDNLNLITAKAGIEKYNPFILTMTHVQAYEAVVDELARQGIMVDADNHVSKPTWCCSQNDGNGFFGDRFFDPDEWLRGVTIVADKMKNKSNVIAIGMRNEPRGASQNEDDWYKYFRMGANRVHEVNPKILIFISGLQYATKLNFLKTKPFGTNLDNKLVFESHWYGLDKSWERPVNKLCPEKVQYYIDQTAFMTNGEDAVPLFFGEFGIDHRGFDLAQDHFLTCLLAAFLTDQDFDFGLWGFQGSYYFRENHVASEETFGVMDYHWNRVRNPHLMERLRIIQRMNQDPLSKLPESSMLFHPQSGTCVEATDDEVITSSCKNFSRWRHEGDGSPIWLEGTDKCLQAVGDGSRPALTFDCNGQETSWTTVSESKFHLAALDQNGEYLCLHKESPFTTKIITTKCLLLEDDSQCPMYPQSDPTIQWFKFVPTNVY